MRKGPPERSAQTDLFVIEILKTVCCYFPSRIVAVVDVEALVTVHL